MQNNNTIERRALGGVSQIGEDPEIQSDYYLEGYATTYGQPYELFTDSETGITYYEMIHSNALQGAEMKDVVLLYDHDSRVMARTTNGTLLLFPADPKGLGIAADMSKSDFAQQIHADTKAGLITGMSWSFVVAPGGDYYNPATHTRIITKIKRVYDVSLVSLPQNDQTSVEARSVIKAAEENVQKEKLDQQRRKCRLLLKL